MHKRKMGTVPVIVTVIILVMVFLFLLYASLSHRQPQITLPAEQGSTDLTVLGEPGADGDPVTRVEVTPETVQNVIATLDRPEHYWRAMTITTYWSGGSGITTVQAYVRGDMIRMDTTLPGGQVRHMVHTQEQTYLWYNGERRYLTLQTGAFSEDDELWIPTYEDLLEEDRVRIAGAGYESCLDTDCIYAATVEDEDGYSQRYWVAVDSGLLIAAERLQNGQTVYRMESPEVTVGEPEASLFVLPDGKNLLSESP